MGKNTYDSIKTILKNRDTYILSNSFTIDSTINNNIIKSLTNYSNLMKFLEKNYKNLYGLLEEKVFINYF